MTVLVPCRDAVAAEIPTSPRRIAKAATEAGWRVRTTYARGELAETDGPDQHVVESVAVRLCRYPLAAVGVWWRKEWTVADSYGFELAYVWSAFSAPRRVDFAGLQAFVKAPA